jgi:hypothetical protein
VPRADVLYTESPTVEEKEPTVISAYHLPEDAPIVELANKLPDELDQDKFPSVIVALFNPSGFNTA